MWHADFGTGNAKLDGLVKDLHLTGDKYSSALATFYVLYVLIDIPANWALKFVGADVGCLS